MTNLGPELRRATRLLEEVRLNLAVGRLLELNGRQIGVNRGIIATASTVMRGLLVNVDVEDGV